ADSAKLVSRAGASTTANNDSFGPALSGNGQFVAFQSRATNLVAGASADAEDNVYLFDSSNSSVSLVSHSRTGQTASGNAGSFGPATSNTGNFVASVSSATALINGQNATAFTNVFLYTRTTRAVTLVSGVGASATTTASGSSDSPSINQDGTLVAFRSD